MADEIKSPDQPSGLGLKSSDAKYSEFLKSIGQQSPADLERRLTDINEKKAAAMKPYLDENKKLATQSRDLAETLGKLKTPDDPKLVAPPAAPETSLEPTVQAMGSLASVLAMFGSLKTRAPLTSALNSGAAAMQAFHKGDKERSELEQKNWKNKLEEGLRLNQEEMQKYSIELEKRNFDIAKAQPMFHAIAAEYKNNTMLAQIEAGNFDDQYKVLETVSNAGLKLGGMLLAHQDKEQALKIHSEDRADDRASRERMHGATLANTKEIAAMRAGVVGGPGGTQTPGTIDQVAKMISEYKMAPLTAMAMRTPWGQAVMAKASEMNPTYDAGQWQQKNKAMRDFGTGKQGQQINSLNVAIQHLGTLQELADAMENKDIQKWNMVANAWSAQTGEPPPTNFDAAKNIIGQEVVKAVVVNGGGVAEREKAGEAIQRSNSPAQLAGVMQTYKKLLGGQMVGLKKQYEADTNRTDFDSKLLPETLKELTEAGSGGKTPERRATDKKPDDQWSVVH